MLASARPDLTTYHLSRPPLPFSFAGTGERWSVEQLQDSIKFDHGYTSQSTAVRHFLEVLAELDALDQRRWGGCGVWCGRGMPPESVFWLE